MFTGIIECRAQVLSVENSGTNRHFWIGSPVSEELKIDQSVSHNGVCLTVDQLAAGRHRVTAIEETLRKTTLNNWEAGTTVNLERCMLLNSRLDGHIVQGHIDTTAVCIERNELAGSWEYRFQFPEHFASLVIEKGSIALNGTSLTCYHVGKDSFRVAVIPYTYEHTTINTVLEGTAVNIEFDLLGKYVQRRMEVGS